ncbi:E3 ubiquitin-protein ligase ARK2C [Dermatophagoides farinae]|uniref:E3 ubiquitin-protein ligase ARK2C n=1 Tax=Dermatophagoides farinae TaxID=6954 RepID=UPI003F5E0357
MAIGFYSSALGIVVGIVAYCCYYYYNTNNNHTENPHGSQRGNNRNARQQNDNGSRSSTIPPKPSDVCIICSDQLTSPLEQLPCKHLFHQKCLAKWFEFDLRCPICRYKLSLAEYEIYKKRL